MDTRVTEVEVHGAKFLLLPERAVYHEASRTLLVADLHWGKAEVFQIHGIAVSSRVLEDDLARLTRALLQTGAQRLIILGDLIHAVSGLTQDVSARVVAWRAQHLSLEILLARGNHDRHLELPPEWRISMHEDGIEEGDFYFAHEPPAKNSALSKLHAWTGHIHPTISLRSRTDSLRLPCFAIGKRASVLPAFSAFTGGQNLRASEWQRVFAIAETDVIEV